MRVVVLADTHLRSGIERLPRSAVEAVDAADVVLHAGDVVSSTALDALAERGPLHAVLGNNDHELVGALPTTLALELGGVRVAMVHDSGARQGRPRRMRRLFPEADLVVFGHSHAPVNEEGLDGQLLFNPGSATQRRREPVCTFGWLVLEGGAVRERRIVAV